MSRINKILQNCNILQVNKTFNILQVRILSKVFKSIKVQETPIYMKRDEDFKSSKKASMKKLEELLNIRSYMAKEVVLKHNKFSKISSYNITENFHFYLKNGVTKNTLMRFPHILAESDISLKINELKKLPYDINISAPFLSLSYDKIKIFVANEIDTKRIACISKTLEVGECETCDFIVKRPFLLSLNVALLKNNIKLLKDSGITKEEIIRDFWVLRYSTSIIKERIALAKANNIEAFKTWMVRAQPEIFENYVKRRSDTKLILGDNSLAEYLSERLECTEEVAKYLISKLPALQNKSLKKMNEMIDFLFIHGFKPIHICRVPKILLHSVETTRNRLRELEAQGMHLDTLYILTKSQRQYIQYYESLTKANKNKLKNNC